MDKELDKSLAEHIANYFYKKGFDDGHNQHVEYERKLDLKELLDTCISDYEKEQLAEARKASPHHHENRLD